MYSLNEWDFSVSHLLLYLVSPLGVNNLKLQTVPLRARVFLMLLSQLDLVGALVAGGEAAGDFQDVELVGHHEFVAQDSILGKLVFLGASKHMNFIILHYNISLTNQPPL